MMETDRACLVSDKLYTDVPSVLTSACYVYNYGIWRHKSNPWFPVCLQQSVSKEQKYGKCSVLDFI